MLEVKTDATSNWINKLLLTVQNDQMGGQREAPVTECVPIRTCSETWLLQFPDPEAVENTSQELAGQSFHITLRKRRVFRKNETLAYVTLPLCWFPQNKVVREWFPMRTKLASAMILLDVHADTKGVQPFEAPFAQLTVLPAWSRPIDRYAPYQPPPVVIVVSNEAPAPVTTAPFVPPVSVVPPMVMSPPSFSVPPPSSSSVPSVPAIPSFPVPPLATPNPYAAGPVPVNPYAIPEVDSTSPYPVIADSSGYGDVNAYIPQFCSSEGYAPPVQTVDCPTVPIQMCTEAY